MVLIPIMLFATASFLASIGVTVAVSFLDTIVGGGSTPVLAETEQG